MKPILSKLAYKCRLCGGVFYPYGVPDGLVMMHHLAYGLEKPAEWGGSTPRMIELHHCADANGSVGIAELLGSVPSFAKE